MQGWSCRWWWRTSCQGTPAKIFISESYLHFSWNTDTVADTDSEAMVVEKADIITSSQPEPERLLSVEMVPDIWIFVITGTSWRSPWRSSYMTVMWLPSLQLWRLPCPSYRGEHFPEFTKNHWGKVPNFWDLGKSSMKFNSARVVAILDGEVVTAWRGNFSECKE